MFRDSCRSTNRPRRLLGLLFVLTWLLALSVGPEGIRTVHADGSRDLNTNGGKRALTEWRTNTTAGLYRRTFFRVYARAGERILMGSSAVGVGSGDIVLYREAQISDSQIAPTALAAITPEFKCSTYRQSNPGAGVLNTRAKELAGPLPASGGYTPCVYIASETGTYWVAMYGPDGPNGVTDGDAGTIDVPNVGTGQRSGVSMWDITVRNAADTANIPGRVFTDYLAQITGGNGPSRRVNSTLYTATEDGFIYQVDLRGLDPFGYIIYGNRVGFLDPDGKTPLYHDLVTNNNQLSNPLGGVILAPASAKIFFSYPAADLPASILPAPVQPSLSNASFQGSAYGNTAYYASGGEFVYTGNIGGINQIIISRDGSDFDPTKPENRVLYAQSIVGVNTIAWDGKDNKGDPFPVGNGYVYRMAFRAGEYHFPMLDVENSRLGGPTITLLNPIGGTCPLATCRHAFYDDRGYRVSTGVNVGTPGVVLPGGANPPATPYSGPGGFDTATTQRAFGDDSGFGFGNWKGLDLWTYFPLAPIIGTLNVIPQIGQDLRIVKSHTGAFDIGDSGGTFSLLVTNVGTATVSDPVTVADSLPASLTYRSASGVNWNCSASGQDVTCTHPNGSGLAPGASLPAITLIVDVSNTAAPSVANTATVTNTNDSNASNNQYTDTAAVNSADIRIAKTVSDDNPAEGDQVSFTITAENLGPSDVGGVAVTDVLPAGLTLVSASTTQGSYASGVWTVGSLPNAASATLTIVASVDALTAGQTLINMATRTASSLYDYNSANDTASATVNVKPTVLTGIVTDAATGTPIVGASITVTDANSVVWTTTTDADGRYTITGLAAGDATVAAAKPGYETGSAVKTVVSGITNVQDLALKNADLLLIKSDGKTTTTAGETLVYTIVVTNTGSLAATGLVVTDTLTDTLSYIACSPACNVNGQTITWSLPSPLPPGGSVTLTLTAFVTDPLPPGTTAVSNYAYVTTTSPESDITDNEQSDIDPILAAPDLKVTITDGQEAVIGGQSLTYHLTYANVGNAMATGSVVTVVVPAGLENIVPADGGVYDSNTRIITWTLGQLAVGGSGALSFTAEVATSITPGAILVAKAAIADDGAHGADQDLSNNTADDSDRVTRPYLTLVKSLSSPARLEAPVTVTMTYSNLSEVTAFGVTLSDPLPNGASYVPGSCSGGTSCGESGGVVTWTIGDVAPGGSGSASFQMTLSASAGGALAAAPSLGAPGTGGSLELLSEVGAASIKGVWQAANPVGPAGWNANPRSLTFDDNSWSVTVASEREPYWFDATEDTYPAEWIAIESTGQLDPNYTFYRAKVCVPPNAAGLSASLILAGDDVSDIYLNGVYVGQQIGGGGTATFQADAAAQTGLNLLAVRLLNNRHGGHAVFGGKDHPGLLFNLGLAWSSRQPFVMTPRVAQVGQPVTFTIDPQALGGVAPLQYRFEFGDGGAQDYSTDADASHTYTTAGEYTARVYVRDAAGCEAYEDVPISVLSSATNLVANTASANYSSVEEVSYAVSSGTAVDLPLVDLALIKSSNPAPGSVGETLTYLLTVTNAGPRTLTSLILTDVLPSALIAPTYTPSAGSYDPITGEWTGIALAQGGSLTLEISGQVDPLFGGALDNVASVSADQASDTNPSNNSDSDNNSLQRLTDLGVDVVGMQSGLLVTYTITVTNNGASGVTSFSLSDQLPAQLSNPLYQPSLGSYDPTTNEWTEVTFLSGDVLTMTVTGTLPSGFPGGSLYYQVSVATPPGTTDANLSNNEDSVTLDSSPTAVGIARLIARPRAISGLAWLGIAAAVCGLFASWRRRLREGGSGSPRARA